MLGSEEESIARDIFNQCKKYMSSEAIEKAINNSAKGSKVRIQVPWGHLAGKWWGPKNVRPILCIHGWMDNLATFETLIPLLPQEFAYLAIDLPGHGFSSSIPHGMRYTCYDFVWIIKLIHETYKWDKVGILAHSIGAIAGFVYAGLYPDKVDFLVAMDALKPQISGSKVRIQVPWGHLAGKWWGPKNVRPILCIHGWMDNLATFETLIPLLPQEFAYLAIDLPGHGFSSPISHGMRYTCYDYVWIIKLIHETYKWDKVGILAHSIGAIAGFVYAGLYPDKVDFLVAMDALKPRISVDIIYEMQFIISNLAKNAQKNQNSKEPPSYSIDDIIKKTANAIYSSIPPDFSPYILSRNLRKSSIYPDKYYFQVDERLKNFQHLLLSQEASILLAKNINIPYLYFRATHSIINYWEMENYLLEIVEEMKKNNSNFFYHEISGIHHEHLCNPSAISGTISDFLRKYAGLSKSVKGNL
ncbi:hypothetical protein DMENIID0001_066120 [Sergentomyia squamirostris]